MNPSVSAKCGLFCTSEIIRQFDSKKIIVSNVIKQLVSWGIKKAPDLQNTKEEALTCVDLFDEVMGEVYPVEAYDKRNGFHKHLDNIRGWINSWHIVDTQGWYGVRELKGSHSITNRVTGKKMTVKSGEANELSPIYSIKEAQPMINIAYGLSESTYKEIKHNAAGSYKINLTGMMVEFNGNKPSDKDVIQKFGIKPKKS